jgi:hypothetical protein
MFFNTVIKVKKAKKSKKKSKHYNDNQNVDVDKDIELELDMIVNENPLIVGHLLPPDLQEPSNWLDRGGKKSYDTQKRRSECKFNPPLSH